MLRHIRIEFTPELSLDEIAKDIKTRFVGLKYYEPHFSGTSVRIGDIHACLNAVVISHWEILSDVETLTFANNGADVALDLFFGDWWMTDKFVKSREEAQEEIAEDWFDPFSKGVLLAFLADRWEDAKRICTWIHAGLDPAYHGVETEIAMFHLISAAEIGQEPFEGLKKLRKRIEKSRIKKAKLLLQAWDAMMAEDQTEFDRLIKDLLRRFDKSVQKTGVGLDFTPLIAQPESIICLVAMHRGLQFPKIPEKLAAYMITRKTLGLED